MGDSTTKKRKRSVKKKASVKRPIPKIVTKKSDLKEISKQEEQLLEELISKTHKKEVKQKKKAAKNSSLESRANTSKKEQPHLVEKEAHNTTEYDTATTKISYRRIDEDEENNISSNPSEVYIANTPNTEISTVMTNISEQFTYQSNQISDAVPSREVVKEESDIMYKSDTLDEVAKTSPIETQQDYNASPIETNEEITETYTTQVSEDLEVLAKDSAVTTTVESEPTNDYKTSVAETSSVEVVDTPTNIQETYSSSNVDVLSPQSEVAVEEQVALDNYVAAAESDVVVTSQQPSQIMDAGASFIAYASNTSDTSSESPAEVVAESNSLENITTSYQSETSGQVSISEVQDAIAAPEFSEPVSSYSAQTSETNTSIMEDLSTATLDAVASTNSSDTYSTTVTESVAASIGASESSQPYSSGTIDEISSTPIASTVNEGSTSYTPNIEPGVQTKGDSSYSTPTDNTAPETPVSQVQEPSGGDEYVSDQSGLDQLDGSIQEAYGTHGGHVHIANAEQAVKTLLDCACCNTYDGSPTNKTSSNNSNQEAFSLDIFAEQAEAYANSSPSEQTLTLDKAG